ncbi:MAG TPA: T9SS type A sorting domain-containing protein, partial [Ignavibacteria bacterium]
TAGGWCGISFINKDTGWASSWSGIYKTTNAGLSYSFLSSTVNCGKIVFLKENYSGEFCGFIISSGALFKSTNSGLNWINVPNSGTYNSISFINKDTGWTYIVQYPSRIMYTSNGGSNWVTQYIDSNNSYSKILFGNNSKGWAGTNVYRILATSNGGITWGTQTIPIYSGGPYPNSFVDSLVGWIGGTGINIAKTTNGGGPIIFTDINNISSNIPESYELKQNYPNPFNSQTTIEIEIKENSNVNLILYDVSGKEIVKLIQNENYRQGSYKVKLDFSRWLTPSGIYFYRLEATNKFNNTLIIQSKKMIYLK